MARDSAWLTIVTVAPVTGVCELCGTDATLLESRVTVRHARGGLAQFTTCSTCTRAMRRIASVVGAEAMVTEATAAHAPPSSSPVDELIHRAPAVEPAELVAELTELFTT